MKFAKYTFLIAGIYGLIVLVPQYFLENKIGGLTTRRRSLIRNIFTGLLGWL